MSRRGLGGGVAPQSFLLRSLCVPNFNLRDATVADTADIARLVRELAEYEKLAHEARATAEDFARALFGTPARAHAMVAESHGRVVGFALYFYNFSTFVGRHGL